MSYKRYDGVYGKALQQKIDDNLSPCPFCGGNPHWLLDLQNEGLTKNNVTCMCEKCEAKLYTESKGLGWDDNMRIVDVGNKNINGLELNSCYHIKSLNSLSKNTISESSAFDADLSVSVGDSANDGELSKTFVADVEVGETDTNANVSANTSANTNANTSTGATSVFKKHKWIMPIVAAVALVVIIFIIVFGARGCKDSEYQDFAETAAKQVVSNNLKSPSSAKWNEVSNMEDNGKGYYIVYVDVEETNGFGAYIRTRFFVMVYNIDLKERTFRHSEVECSGKNDVYKLALLKGLYNYDGSDDGDIDDSDDDDDQGLVGYH